MEKSKTPSIFHYHQQSLIKQPKMICCFKQSDSTTTQRSICRRRHQQSLKVLDSKKLVPNLESKVIGPPDSRHKPIRHPSTHKPPEQTPKPLQKLGPPLSRFQIHKTEKRWNNSTNRSSSNKNKPKKPQNQPPQAPPRTPLPHHPLDHCTVLPHGGEKSPIIQRLDAPQLHNLLHT
jgi:hypothetical protein